ncbi:LytTR family DNA-binding domain-containing protein [Marinicaulis aureus]|uniref:LytTR family DNA-binding domain-containing protein n=1 Tax=Hyphococcus aureus TaxID=2666033 RepID=A0ABW1KRY2_9PROT
MALIRKYFWLGLVSTLALGAVFAFLGVYDTDNLPFQKRYIFWTSTMVTGTAAGALAGPWVFNHVLRGRNTIAQLAVVAALISCPVLLVIVGFSTGFTSSWPTNDLPMQYARVFAISFILVSGTYVAAKALGVIGVAAVSSTSDPSPITKFLSRLPAKYRGAELYAVSSEDHYLRIHTDRGEELILMRLSDAMRELEGAEGLQTHRSWWVASKGVDEMSRENGKQTLMLKSGVAAPVSRSFAKAVREAGLGGL